jgi:hypothetical protein
LDDRLPPLRGYLPILVPASYYGKSLVRAVADTLRDRDGVRVSEETITDQLETGRFLILFDGVSEVTGDRQQAMDEILRVARSANYPGCRFVISTRPPEVLPAGVRTLELQPLTPKVVEDLLEHYPLGTGTANQARRQLRSFGDRPIEPLLLDMILKQGDEEGVSDTRAQVYERYFRRLLRAEASQDEWDGWRMACETLARDFMLSTGRRGVGLPHEPLLDQISGNGGGEGLAARVRRLHNLVVGGERELLTRLEDAGLLRRVRSRWRFAHDTFEEYFAASFVVTFADTREQAPPLERWSTPLERQQEFLETVDFVRELTVEAGHVREILRAGFPPPWRERLDQEG